MSPFYVLLAVYISHVSSMEHFLVVKKDLESTSLKNFYFGIREDDPICPEEPDYPESGTELDPCIDAGEARKTRKVGFYLLTEGKNYEIDEITTRTLSDLNFTQNHGQCKVNSDSPVSEIFLDSYINYVLYIKSV